MAELLVRAVQPANTIQDIGDIVIVKPDGHIWGNAECLPDYLVVKLPGISIATLKHFELPLEQVTNAELSLTALVKRRKFRIPTAWIQSKVALGETVVTLTKTSDKNALINGVIEKTIG